MKAEDTWDRFYKKLNYPMRYPCEHLIRFMAKNYYNVPDRSAIRVLDIGCGACQNTIYLAKEGFSVYGLDISKEAVWLGKTKCREEGVDCKLYEGNIIDIDFNDCFIDVVIDIQTIQHNLWDNIQKSIKEIKRILIPEGRFFGMLVSVDDHSYGKGKLTEPGTLVNVVDSTFEGGGITHFFSIEEIKHIFSNWNYLNIEKTVETRKSMKERIVYYLVEAVK